MSSHPRADTPDMSLGIGIDALSPLAERLFAAVAPADRFAVRDLDASEDEFGILIEGETCLHDGSWDDPKATGRFEVLLDRMHDELHFGDLLIPPALQGQGYGRAAMLRLADVGRDAGCHALRLDAEQDGRYSWARCGFDFETSSDRDHIVMSAARVARRLGIAFDEDAIEQPRDVSDFPGTVSREQLQAAGVRHPFRGEVVSLGRALLLGPDLTHWRGTLGLTDEHPGYVRLRRYVLGR
jgi:GNAT superfamily N-acetyltransferase